MLVQEAKAYRHPLLNVPAMNSPIHLRVIGTDRFQRARGHYLTIGLIYLTVVSALV